MILVDTSVWVDHLRTGDSTLASLLEAGTVLAHPFVVGEFALGNLRDREAVLDTLSSSPRAVIASDAEVLDFVEHSALFWRGIAWVDAHLLASARLSAARLWTRDRRLRAAAEAIGLAA